MDVDVNQGTRRTEFAALLCGDTRAEYAAEHVLMKCLLPYGKLHTEIVLA